MDKSVIKITSKIKYELKCNSLTRANFSSDPRAQLIMSIMRSY